MAQIFGYGNEQDITKLLCQRCSSDKLDVVKDQHKVDPNGEQSRVTANAWAKHAQLKHTVVWLFIYTVCALSVCL